MKLKSKILIIAGSDSSGGAGIQADIKTVTSLGSYAMTAITAITSQNTKGVKTIVPIAAKEIFNQIIHTTKDINPDAIKIGMLHSSKVINVVINSIGKTKAKKIVLDPVMVAKGGTKLIDNKAISLIKNRLMSKVTLITPNIPEAEILTKTQIKNKEDQQLLYAVIAYGKRNSEIYSLDWNNLKVSHASKLITTYSPKNGKSGITWQIPFGDETIDLSDFRPPNWDELKCLSGQRKEETKAAVTRISNKISVLSREKLGCEPTDLRHRWACKALIKNEVHAVSSAMGTSVAMLQKTYSREINQFKMENWSPAV